MDATYMDLLAGRAESVDAEHLTYLRLAPIPSLTFRDYRRIATDAVLEAGAILAEAARQTRRARLIKWEINRRAQKEAA